MKKILSVVLRIVLSLFNVFETQTKQVEKLEKDLRDKRKIRRINEAREGVANGDEDSLNKIIEKTRQKKSVSESGEAECFSILSMFLFFGFIFFLAGCITRTETIVVPADRQVVRTDRNGIPGWFVPDATMADLMEAYVSSNSQPIALTGQDDPETK